MRETHLCSIFTSLAILYLDQYSHGLVQSPCCLSKVVGDAVYSLVESSLPVPGECMDSCAYTRNDDNSGHFCFQAGPLPYECLCPASDINTDGWGIKIIARSSQDNQAVPGAVADVSMRKDDGQEVQIHQELQFESNGTLFISIVCNGLYLVKIRAGDFIVSVEEITVDCTEAECEVEKLVAMSPELEVGQTRIIMTWDDKPMDVDIHVMAVSKDDSGELCRTWYNNKTGCPAVSQDRDNAQGGMNGAETVTLLNNTVNSKYTYMVAVEDFKFESDGEHFLRSGTRIRVTNGIKTVDSIMEAMAVDKPEEFYLFGCLDVKEDGSFEFNEAANGTFFNGHIDANWEEMAENHCQFSEI